MQNNKVDYIIQLAMPKDIDQVLRVLTHIDSCISFSLSHTHTYKHARSLDHVRAMIQILCKYRMLQNQIHD